MKQARFSYGALRYDVIYPAFMMKFFYLFALTLTGSVALADGDLIVACGSLATEQANTRVACNLETSKVDVAAARQRKHPSPKNDKVLFDAESSQLDCINKLQEACIAKFEHFRQ